MNPTIHYISIVANRNVAFFQIRKTKIRLVVVMNEDEVRNRLNHHKVVSLAESVQKFWNGPSCAIVIDTQENLEEVLEVLYDAIERNLH